MKAGNLGTKCQGVDTSEGTKKTTRLRSKFFDSEGEALSYEKIVLANEQVSRTKRVSLASDFVPERVDTGWLRLRY
jgi:hypothetical protein